MAYIKYKELTKYFNFEVEIDTTKLPQYVIDYIEEFEEIYGAYKNSRDYIVFTSDKIVLFDKTPFTAEKKIHIIPYYSISTSTLSFTFNKANILASLDSGYPLRINFIKMSDSKKKNLRLLYKKMMKKKIELTSK